MAAISSLPGLKCSVTSRGSCAPARTSFRTRSRRSREVLAWATRITSSKDMRTARWRATSGEDVALRLALKKLIAEGKTLEQVLAAKPTADFDEAWGQGFMKPARWIEINYQGMTAN